MMAKDFGLGGFCVLLFCGGSEGAFPPFGGNWKEKPPGIGDHLTDRVMFLQEVLERRVNCSLTWSRMIL